MKIIITENQLKDKIHHLIKTEGVKNTCDMLGLSIDELIQKFYDNDPLKLFTNDNLNKLINSILITFKNVCETLNTEDDEYISFSVCDLIDGGLKLIVSDVRLKDEFLIITINGEYNNYSYMDEDALIFELQYELYEHIGNNRIIMGDWTNTFNHR